MELKNTSVSSVKNIGPTPIKMGRHLVDSFI